MKEAVWLIWVFFLFCFFVCLFLISCVYTMYLDHIHPPPPLGSLFRTRFQTCCFHTWGLSRPRSATSEFTSMDVITLPLKQFFTLTRPSHGFKSLLIMEASCPLWDPPCHISRRKREVIGKCPRDVECMPALRLSLSSNPKSRRTT